MMTRRHVFGNQPSLERLQPKRSERLRLEDCGRQLVHVTTARIDHVDFRSVGADSKLLHFPDRRAIRDIGPCDFACTVDVGLNPDLLPITGAHAAGQGVHQCWRCCRLTCNRSFNEGEISNRLFVGGLQPHAHQLRGRIHPRSQNFGTAVGRERGVRRAADARQSKGDKECGAEESAKRIVHEKASLKAPPVYRRGSSSPKPMAVRRRRLTVGIDPKGASGTS